MGKEDAYLIKHPYPAPLYYIIPPFYFPFLLPFLPAHSLFYIIAPSLYLFAHLFVGLFAYLFDAL